MNKKLLLISTRLFFGTLSLVAVITQLGIQISNGNSLVNFFSFFTNLANIFAAVVLLYTAVYLIKGRELTTGQEAIRGASVVYMVIVGIVFTILLRDVDLGSLLPWVNTVHHYIMPVVIVADWLLQPPAAKFTNKHIKYWLLFPFVYLAYSLVRGAIVGFYAYPFLNPSHEGGYTRVGIYCVAILVVFLVTSLLIVALSSKLRRRFIPAF